MKNLMRAMVYLPAVAIGIGGFTFGQWEYAPMAPTGYKIFVTLLVFSWLINTMFLAVILERRAK